MTSEIIVEPPGYGEQMGYLAEAFKSGASKEAVIRELFEERGVASVGQAVAMVVYYDTVNKKPPKAKAKKKEDEYDDGID